MNTKPKILYLIQLPPPIHGVSVINQQVFESKLINDLLEKSILEIKFSKRFAEIRKITIKKVFLFIFLCFRLIGIITRNRPYYAYFSFMPVGKGFLRDLIILFILKINKVKPILHLHNRGIARQAKKNFYKWLYERAFSGAEIIHLSKSLIVSEFTALDLKKSRFHVVTNGIYVPERIKPIKEKSGEEIMLLFFSNIIEEKGVFLLLEVLSSLIRKYPFLKLSIGGAPYNNNDIKLKSMIESNERLFSRVQYLGEISGKEKYRYFEESDIFVFPSYFQEECFPLVIIEAMASGLPIVASSIGAINEIIDSGENGYLVTPRNKNEIRDSLEKLIMNKSLREQISINNLRKYKEYYTRDKFESRMFKVISEIIKIK